MNNAAARYSSLATSFRLGAVYDGLLAAAMIASPPALLSALRFPPPADPFLFRLTAMPLLLFPFVYLFAARHPEPGRGAVSLAILLRGGGGAILGLMTLIHRPPGGHVYLVAAAIDVAWAALHAAIAARANRNAPGV